MHTIENTDGTKVIFPDLTSKCWSLDCEDFNYESLGELIDAHSDLLEVGQVVYYGTLETPSAGEFLNVDSIIEQMGERAWDEYGEYADGYPDLNKDAIKELDEFLIAWGNKYCPPTFHSVENIKEYTLTEDDIQDQLMNLIDITHEKI